LQVPGIKAAITAKDLPQTVRFYGEEIAAVCGTTKQACLDALRAIEVTAKPRPFVVLEDDAKKDDAPQVWDGKSNVSSSPRGSREQGSVDRHSRMRRCHRRFLHHGGAASQSDGDARQHRFLDG
jgi:CO/xanthine dehydrogenase Mo-binding subunit